MSEERQVAKVFNGGAEYIFKVGPERWIETKSLGNNIIELRSVKRIQGCSHAFTHERLAVFAGDTAVLLEWEKL